MLNFQIGKKYRSRNGAVRTVVSIIQPIPDGEKYVNFDNNKGSVYYKTGMGNRETVNEWDIIEEVKENEMKIEVGKWYKTRSGHKAFVGGELNNLRYYGHIGERIREWDSHGVLYGHGNELDLIEEWKEPKSGVAYINVYDKQLSPLYESRSYADNVSSNGRIACVRVEWKEGQFDD